MVVTQTAQSVDRASSAWAIPVQFCSVAIFSEVRVKVAMAERSKKSSSRSVRRAPPGSRVIRRPPSTTSAFSISRRRTALSDHGPIPRVSPTVGAGTADSRVAQLRRRGASRSVGRPGPPGYATGQGPVLPRGFTPPRSTLVDARSGDRRLSNCVREARSAQRARRRATTTRRSSADRGDRRPHLGAAAGPARSTARHAGRRSRFTPAPPWSTAGTSPRRRRPGGRARPGSAWR